MPRKHIGAFKATQAQVAVRWIKPIMLVIAVAVKDEPRRARLVVEFHRDSEIERRLGRLRLRDQQRPAAESCAKPIDDDASCPLLPASAKQRLPLRAVNRTDRQPAVYRHGI